MGKGMKAGKRPKAPGAGNMQKQMQQMQQMQRKMDELQAEKMCIRDRWRRKHGCWT